MGVQGSKHPYTHLFSHLNSRHSYVPSSEVVQQPVESAKNSLISKNLKNLEKEMFRSRDLSTLSRKESHLTLTCSKKRLSLCACASNPRPQAISIFIRNCNRSPLVVWIAHNKLLRLMYLQDSTNICLSKQERYRQVKMKKTISHSWPCISSDLTNRNSKNLKISVLRYMCIKTRYWLQSSI